MKENPRIEPCEVHTELDPYCSQCSHHMLYLIDKLRLDLKTAWFEKEILFDQLEEVKRQIELLKR